MNILNLLNIDKDMIIIYFLIVLMAILLIIIFTLDTKNKKKNIKEEAIIEGTTPLDQYQKTNNLQAKVIQKIQELEDIKPHEEEIQSTEEAQENSNIKYEKQLTEDEEKEQAKEKLNQVALDLIDDKQSSNLTNFEIEQEENAIISYNELLKVSENLYEQNEKTQYADEGNEPITIEQLKEKFANEQDSSSKPEEGHSDLVEAIEKIEQEERPKVKLNDFVVQNEDKSALSKFKTSPIISPVYGIEKESNIKEKTEIELEQTADLDKLDAEIRKTNQFLQLLKELQKKLD